MARSLRWHRGVRGRSAGGAIPASPTWLQLPARDLKLMIDILYTEAMAIPVRVEHERLEQLEEPGAWECPRHMLIAEMIRVNGLAIMLWSCAPVVIEMLRALWHSDVPVHVGWDGQPQDEDGDMALDIEPELG